MQRTFLRIALSFVMIFCLAPLSYASTAIAENNDLPQQKVHHVKMLINKDGKLTEKDTTLVSEDKTMTFAIAGNANSDSDKASDKKITVTVNDEKVTDNKGDHVKTFIFTPGDTLQKNIVRKFVRTKDGKPLIIMQNSEGENVGTSTIPAHGEQRVILRKMKDPFAFNPNDTNIISYSKKDIGKGKEKIVIIRKKVEK